MNARGWALLCLIAAGCGPTQIEGSLSTLIDLKYEKVDLAIVNDQAALRFLTRQGAGQNVVLKVTTALTGIPVRAGTLFDLTELLPNGQQRGTVTRDVLNDPLQTFPTLQKGQFSVDHTPVSGQQVSGYFSVTFDLGIDRASGNAAYAHFRATVL